MAIEAHRPGRASAFGGAALIVALAMMAACAPRPAPAPAPPPRAQEPVRPAPRPLPPPPPLAWEDAPLTPGDWSYGGSGSTGSAARYNGNGGMQFALVCEPGRQISLGRSNAPAGNLIVRTSFGQRTLQAAPRDGALIATLDAHDPMLDGMAFSRGRFAVEAAGAPLLILPAWPEVARVIEDCRR